jgi:SAM-dependent methyltransferase
MNPEKALEFLECPDCHKPLKLDSGYPVCTGCKRLFDKENDLFCFFREDIPVSGKWVKLMNSDFLINIYESFLWRRNPLLTWGMGITFGRESKLIRDYQQIKPDSNCLDVACGPGIYTRPFAKSASKGNVFGLDISRKLLRYADKTSKANKLGNVQFVQGDAQNLPFVSDRFDTVNCCGAMHLLPQPQKAFDEFRRVLKKGGKFTGAMGHENQTKISQYTKKRDWDVYEVKLRTLENVTGMMKQSGFEPTPLFVGNVWLVIGGVAV